MSILWRKTKQIQTGNYCLSPINLKQNHLDQSDDPALLLFSHTLFTEQRQSQALKSSQLGLRAVYLSYRTALTILNGTNSIRVM